MDELQIETLNNGAYRLCLAPRLGGVVTEFSSSDGGEVRQWMRTASPEDLLREGAIHASCYPLVPFSNRIAQGRFSFEGRDVTLPTDPLLPPHTIHGHGWRAAWDVIERSAASILLKFGHGADSWPWNYEATQRFALDEDGLRVEMTLTNLSETTMPAGLGLHPHFPASGDVQVQAKVTKAHLGDETLLPVAKSRDHDAIAPLDAGGLLPRGLDLCFEGWDGLSEIRWPAEGRGLRISADGPVRHLVVFSPPGESYFCIEPVSHCVNAVNLNPLQWGETGLVQLAPSAVLSVTVMFEPFAL